ncbi:recombinase family protein [Pseudomonas savastanoi pv. phaseolicola]|nr:MULTISPECIES: recombinase family protein [Pseudomonas syringae group]MDG6382380.1 recombinase family protein [Pseudomonas savastanoi pv. phaseolicola]
MRVHMYLRASSKGQDSDRAKPLLMEFVQQHGLELAEVYSENFTGTKLLRPVLMRLLSQANPGDILLVESIDRLSRLELDDWTTLKAMLHEQKLRLVVEDLPTTHQQLDDSVPSQYLALIRDLVTDLVATQARISHQKRVQRIRQAFANKRAADPNWKLPGKQRNAKRWAEIQRLLLKHPTATALEIATLAGCGVATVYRVKKEIKSTVK